MTAADVYAVACLAGGPVRAVDTAVVALLDDGRLRVEETGELSTVALRYTSPVEAAVLDAVGRRARRSVHTVRFRCAGDDRLSALVDGLVGAGLLRGARPGRSPRATGPGRLVLREARARARDSAPWRVALDGLDALPGQALRRRVFDVPRTPHRIGRGYLDLDVALGRADGRSGMVAVGGDRGPGS
jgi:hypothetical protein